MGGNDRWGRRSPSRLLVWGALALLWGCGGEGASEEAWALVGTGSTSFVPLADGDLIELEAGAQGGWHVWISVRAGGFGEQARLHTLLEPEGWDGPRQEGSHPIELEPVDGEGFRRSIGSAAVLSYAECFVGRPMRLTLELTDASGRRATDERILVPAAPPSPPMGECMWEPRADRTTDG